MTDTIWNWVKNFDLISFILGIVLSSLFGIWLAYYIKRPKLVSTGGGGGRGPNNTWSNSISVTNQDGFIGIAIRETIILGKLIHGPLRKGQTIVRSTARECMAILFDKKTNRVVGHLLWQTYDSSNQVKFQNSINIESGKSVTLKVFARTQAEPLKYFRFEPENLNSDILKIPDGKIKFENDREFLIQIRSKDSSKKLEINCRVYKDLSNGNLYFARDNGCSIF